MIRSLIPEDINKIKEIHEEYFKEEFECPDFTRGYLNAFTVVDKDDNIITSGGVRLLPEIVMLSNKAIPIKERRSAQHLMLEVACFTAKRLNYDNLYAFTTEEKWARHMKNAGFYSTKGKAFILNL